MSYTRFEWDEANNRRNTRKHGLSFSTAASMCSSSRNPARQNRSQSTAFHAPPPDAFLDPMSEEELRDWEGA